MPFPHNKLRSVPQNLPRYSCNTAFIFFLLLFFRFASSALPNFVFFSGLYLCQWGSCLKRFSFETTLRLMVKLVMKFGGLGPFRYMTFWLKTFWQIYFINKAFRYEEILAHVYFGMGIFWHHGRFIKITLGHCSALRYYKRSEVSTCEYFQ